MFIENSGDDVKRNIFFGYHWIAKWINFSPLTSPNFNLIELPHLTSKTVSLLKKESN